MNEPRNVEFSYWSDPMCIWALVAQPKLERIIDAHGDHLKVHHRVVPVFGSIRWRLSEGSWAAKGAEGRAEASARVAREHGIDGVTGKVWLEDTPVSSWNAGLAVKAVDCLEREGGVPPGTGAEYHRLLRERFFLHDLNTARRNVQLELCEHLEIPREEIEHRLDDGRAMAALWEDFHAKETLHIQGSPTYVFDGGRAMLYGNFDFKVLEATVRELVEGLMPGGSAC